MFSSPRVLFICVHNSGRSQMCEAFLKHYAGDRFDAQSAGLEPGRLNRLVAEVMAEIGIDISQNKTKSVFDIWKSGELVQYVIAVCDAESAEKCPIFPGTHNASALVFSRSIKGYRNVRAEVGEGSPNSRRDRGKNSRVVGVSSD
jgi:protein-tyrosine-phosphatase